MINCGTDDSILLTLNAELLSEPELSTSISADSGLSATQTAPAGFLTLDSQPIQMNNPSPPNIKTLNQFYLFLFWCTQ